MRYTFSAVGHPNITSRHRNTFEFTKDENLKTEGDCIIGVKADYSIKKIRQLIKLFDSAEMEIAIGSTKEKVMMKINKDFNDEREIVIRKTEFNSARTLGINADKAASNFGKDFIERLKDDKSRISVTLKGM